MIYISTGGSRNCTATETAITLRDAGLYNVELSGGRYSKHYHGECLSLLSNMHLQVHNYYPPPKEPFVFNLASSDKSILNLSLEHARTAIRLSADIGRPIYSFHAGFRINPKVSELGKKLQIQKLTSRDEALSRFFDSVSILSEEAKTLGVNLLIENNVINQVSYLSYGEDPLLFTEPNEIAAFMNQAPSNVGLLLDVAHLKVSGHTLGFDIAKSHNNLLPWIRGYHLSDNDGLRDSNSPFTANSWFWKYINPSLDLYTIEVYGISEKEMVAQYDLTSLQLEMKKKDD